MESLLYNYVLDTQEQIDSSLWQFQMKCSFRKKSVTSLVGQLGLSKFTGSFLMVSVNSPRLVDFH